MALNGGKGLEISESDNGSGVSFSQPVRCVYCAVLIHLQESVVNLEEDARVRNVQYR